MDILKTQFARLREQLSGLSASQKMLAASLVAIMVMTLVWWGRYAADPEMQPVLTQVSPDDLGQITAQLESHGIPFKVDGDKVTVPADRKLEALGDLSFAQALPKNIASSFDDIMKEMSPFDSQSKTDAMYNEAKQRTLQQIIASFPGVTGARVVIDPSNERKLDGTSVHPSAMVSITQRGRDLSKAARQQLAESAASVVCGACAGMDPGWVSVLIDGKAAALRNRDGADGGMGGDSLVDQLREDEAFYSDKVRSHLGYIENLFVSVTVDLNTAQTSTEELIYDPKAVAHAESRVHEHSEETTNPPAAAEPGAVPNMGMSVSAAPASGGSSTTTDSETTSENKFSQKQTTTRQGPGGATPTFASVRVPRSYFVGTYKSTHRAAEPDEATLSTWADAEMSRIRAAVRSCTGIKVADAVTVDLYNDVVLDPAAATAAPQVAMATPVTLMLGSHTKEIGAAALAAFSLFMVSTMVRKSAAVAAVAGLSDSGGGVDVVALSDAGGGGRISGDLPLAGEVSEGGALLDGRELDPEAVQTQQMLNQVQEMVGANPDAAAQLVKRWLNRA